MSSDQELFSTSISPTFWKKRYDERRMKKGRKEEKKKKGGGWSASAGTHCAIFVGHSVSISIVTLFSRKWRVG